MSSSGLSACVVPTANVDRIGECLAALSFCDEVFVLACGPHSKKVRAAASSIGARVLPASNRLTLASRRQAAVDAARHDWVLNLDANDIVTPRLRDEIEYLRANGFAGCSGFAAPRCTHYFGRPIRHGGWYPDRRLRLFDRTAARWDERVENERVIAHGHIADLQGEIEHHAYRSLTDQRLRLQHYAEWSARNLHANGHRARLRRLLTDPAWRVFRGLVLQGGWLDGWRGFAIALLEADSLRQRHLMHWWLQHGLAVSDRDLGG
jgi:hypothetical protein